MNIITLVLGIILLAVGVGLLIAWGGLQATSFLFGWPAEVTWVHTVAAWFLLLLVSNIFRHAGRG